MPFKLTMSRIANLSLDFFIGSAFMRHFNVRSFNFFFELTKGELLTCVIILGSKHLSSSLPAKLYIKNM